METSTTPPPSSPGYVGQLDAMRRVADALAGLEPEDIEVVLQWAFRQFLKKTIQPEERQSVSAEVGPSALATPAATPAFKTLSDLFAAAAPESGPERALVVGYWFQEVVHNDDLEGAQINSELTHLGYKLANITATMSLLMNQKPALVVQTKKTGTAQQARKRYRLTHAGIKRVAELIANAKAAS